MFFIKNRQIITLFCCFFNIFICFFYKKDDYSEQKYYNDFSDDYTEVIF